MAADPREGGATEDPRARRSRAALRETLADLLNAGPLEAITVQALTERAGVGYATFFRHYADIDALLAELSASLVQELAALLRPLDPQDQRDAAREIVRFAQARRTLLRPLFLGASATVQRAILDHALAAASRSGGGADPALPPGLAMGHTVGAVLEVLTWWLREGDACTPEQLAAFLDRLAFAPVAPPDVPEAD